MYDLSFRTLHKRMVPYEGTGQTLNISSSGVSFAADRVFSVGTALELKIEWPIQRGDQLPLILVVIGRVARSSAEQSGLKARKTSLQLRSDAHHAVYSRPILALLKHS